MDEGEVEEGEVEGRRRRRRRRRRGGNEESVSSSPERNEAGCGEGGGREVSWASAEEERMCTRE